MKNEDWKPAVGYEGIYEVSDLGRVRSLDRTVTISNGRQRQRLGRVLKLGVSGKYKVVMLSDANGCHVTHKVHRLVLAAFVGPGEGIDGCHNNGNGLDNRLENLRWDTRSGNEKDKLRHGTHNRGERHPNLALTAGAVQQIVAMRNAGMGNKEICSRTGVSPVSAWRAIRFGGPQPRR